jgi:hypothetical protein
VHLRVHHVGEDDIALHLCMEGALVRMERGGDIALMACALIGQRKYRGR